MRNPEKIASRWQELYNKKKVARRILPVLLSIGTRSIIYFRTNVSYTSDSVMRNRFADSAAFATQIYSLFLIMNYFLYRMLELERANNRRVQIFLLRRLMKLVELVTDRTCTTSMAQCRCY
jgi:hypothetical protein